jgi:hypothetical protein
MRPRTAAATASAGLLLALDCAVCCSADLLLPQSLLTLVVLVHPSRWQRVAVQHSWRYEVPDHALQPAWQYTHVWLPVVAAAKPSGSAAGAAAEFAVVYFACGPALLQCD